MPSEIAQQPDLRSYDVVLVNSSAGKDSQVMLDHVVGLCDGAGISRSRIVVVHCDLGRVEWVGTRALAERQASHYGLRFEVVSRPQGDLLAQVEGRGKWPSSTARYCTSDHKRGQVRTLMTRLADEHRAAGGGQVRILNCMGLRAEESPARAKKVAFEHDAKSSNGRRHVDTWLPVHEWTTEQVWERIRQSGVEHHRAYDLGMKRLSCVFCVFAPKSALLVAGAHNRELLGEYVRLERKIHHTFRKNFTIESVQEELERGVDAASLAVEDTGCWNM
jgi:3'-phosphoadenosine 5'-phosphosulfate sulfotransferase (PAPS reductase)/FAD synthetase